jgi:nucleotide-binding universal stress UspA family protein
MYDEIRSILVPSDFSESCDNALNHAIELGRYLKAKINVLHVVTEESAIYLANEGCGESAAGTEAGEDAIVKSRLNTYIRSKGYADIEGISRRGDIFHTIAEVAEATKAQLIILGTHGKIGFQRITGSYALKVIDSTEVPVIVVQKKGFQHGYRDIVFPVSLQEQDRQKAKHAVQIAKVFDSTVHLLSRCEDEKAGIEKLSARVQQIKEYFDEHSVKYIEVSAAEYGADYGRQVVNYCGSANADLVLIMSDAEKHSNLFGAKEENVIFNSAQTPLMCINTERIARSSFWSWGNFAKHQ